MHVSAVQATAHAILHRLGPLLKTVYVPFKVAAEPWVLGLLNEGGFGDTQVGKFMTVYVDMLPIDAQGSVEKAVALLGEAAGRGAELAVLPETFVPLYPSNRWAHDAARFAGWD